MVRRRRREERREEVGEEEEGAGEQCGHEWAAQREQTSVARKGRGRVVVVVCSGEEWEERVREREGERLATMSSLRRGRERQSSSGVSWGGRVCLQLVWSVTQCCVGCVQYNVE